MNKVIILLTLFCAAILLSCRDADSKKMTFTQSTELTLDEKESIKKDIAGRINEIIKGAKALNADSALKPYFNDSSFKIINPDASVSGYERMQNDQAAFFNSVKSLNFTTIKEDFKFLANNLVICTWTGYNEFELKTGGKYRMDPYVGSMLFKKTGKEWTIIYAHESAGQPVKLEAGK
ncbi:MAG: hypothetical protein U0V75_02675 [Ferruginibacter sp.]